MKLDDHAVYVAIDAAAALLRERLRGVQVHAPTDDARADYRTMAARWHAAVEAANHLNELRAYAKAAGLELDD